MKNKHPLTGRKQTKEHVRNRVKSLVGNGKLKGKPTWNKGTIGKLVEDLTGRRFGRLVVLKYAGRQETNRGSKWECRCDCGNIKTTTRGALMNGFTVSCGCFNKENAKKLGLSNTGKKNGMHGRFDHFRRMGLASAKALGENKPTSIERIVYSFLESSGVVFEKQKIINGKFTVDAFIPSSNTVIECDGVYWHSLPKIQNKDKSENAYLRKCGFKVIRLSEQEIRNGEFQGKLIAAA